MSNRDLLKEAIADAKTIKETVIANAKAALEEAFAPQLRSMLSAKLEEMEKEDMDEEIEEVVTNEAKDEIEEAKEDMDEGYGKEDMDEELDLDEILAELEEGEDKEDVKEAEEIDEAKEEMTEAEEIEEAEEDEEVEVDAEEEDSEEGEDEDEEIDLEEMSEEDLKAFIEDVIADMVEAGELEAGEEFEAEDEEVEGDEEIEIEDESEEIMEGEEKEEIDEADAVTGLTDVAGALAMAAPALAAILGLGVAAVKDKLEKGGKEAKDLVAQANAKAKSMEEGEDKDMMDEVNELRAELHEVNLLNAKLLYSNKIFRAKNLKEAQKVKVLEAFDKASNVSEVKLVFETLSEEVKETKTVVKENLGSASKAVGMIAENKAPIVDVNPQVARWQKLAGIK